LGIEIIKKDQENVSFMVDYDISHGYTVSEMDIGDRFSFQLDGYVSNFYVLHSESFSPRELVRTKWMFHDSETADDNFCRLVQFYHEVTGGVEEGEAGVSSESESLGLENLLPGENRELNSMQDGVYFSNRNEENSGYDTSEIPDLPLSALEGDGSVVRESQRYQEGFDLITIKVGDVVVRMNDYRERGGIWMKEVRVVSNRDFTEPIASFVADTCRYRKEDEAYRQTPAAVNNKFLGEPVKAEDFHGVLGEAYKFRPLLAVSWPFSLE